MELQLSYGKLIFEITPDGMDVTMGDETIHLSPDEAVQLQEWTADNVPHW